MTLPHNIITGDFSDVSYSEHIKTLSEGFAQRGIPTSIFEKRIGKWMTEIPTEIFLDGIDALMLKGTKDQWDDAFYFADSLTDREWIKILELQTRKRGAIITNFVERDNQSAKAKRKVREKRFAVGIFGALSVLYGSLYLNSPKNSDLEEKLLQPVAETAHGILERIQILLEEYSSPKE